MMTERDYQAVDFIKKFKVADTKIIASLFYPSEHKARMRLCEIVNKTEIKRTRLIINEPYYYFYRKIPEQLKHSLKVAEFYKEIKKYVRIKQILIEPNFERIRPDMAFSFEYGGSSKVGLLEVELSNKGFDYYKYENWFMYHEWEKYASSEPFIFVVSKNKKADIDNNRYAFINTDLTEIGKIIPLIV